MPAVCEKPVRRDFENYLAPDEKSHIRRELTGLVHERGKQKDIFPRCVAIADILSEILQTEQHSPIQAALLRGKIAKEKYKQYSPSFSTEECARALGISRQAVLKRLHQGKLLGWQENKQNAFRIPAWQFENTGVLLSGMSSVLKVLHIAGLSGWGKIVFFLQKRASLNGGTPLDLLKAGHLQHIIELGEDYVS